VATNGMPKGILIGACSCDWGVRAVSMLPQRRENVKAAYVWNITEGRFGEVPLAGLSMSWLAHSPAALHKGNVTGLTLIDEKANAAQRAALTTLSREVGRAVGDFFRCYSAPPGSEICAVSRRDQNAGQPCANW